MDSGAGKERTSRGVSFHTIFLISASVGTAGVVGGAGVWTGRAGGAEGTVSGGMTIRLALAARLGRHGPALRAVWGRPLQMGSARGWGRTALTVLVVRSELP